MSVATLGSLTTLPPVIERYELKYMIPVSLIEPITDYLMVYCEYDQHSLAHDDRYYTVNSLYFDSPNFRFLRQRMDGAERRFNMRVRAYDDGQSGPYFAEIKFKTSTSVRKFRAILDKNEWPGFLKQSVYQNTCRTTDEKELVSRQLFLHLADAYCIEPKIFTCYRRRALFSKYDDYARVTFDIDMRYRPQDPMASNNIYSLSPTHDCVNYDAQNIYEDEAHHEACVVLELKATIGAVPVWMVDLIRRFNLKQVGFSKYMNSSLTEHIDNGWHYMSSDRTAGAYFY